MRTFLFFYFKKKYVFPLTLVWHEIASQDPLHLSKSFDCPITLSLSMLPLSFIIIYMYRCYVLITHKSYLNHEAHKAELTTSTVIRIGSLSNIRHGKLGSRWRTPKGSHWSLPFSQVIFWWDQCNSFGIFHLLPLHKNKGRLNTDFAVRVSLCFFFPLLKTLFVCVFVLTS
jgi:hypothetical protein